MFKVFIKKTGNSYERKQVFHNPFEAEKYFNELCQVRTDEPAAVIAANQDIIKKQFRIDRGYFGDRFQANENLLE